MCSTDQCLSAHAQYIQLITDFYDIQKPKRTVETCDVRICFKIGLHMTRFILEIYSAVTIKFEIPLEISIVKYGNIYCAGEKGAVAW